VVTRNPTTPAYRFFIIVLITLAGSLLVTILLPPQTLAALPPRPTPLPTRSPRHNDDTNSDNDEAVGGQIELQVQPSPVELWTVVQWQDALGGWHNVEGWQGPLDDGARKVWWVARPDFGKGPFRWNVYRDLTGQPLAGSKAFSLPQSANEIVKVELLLQSR
jgi:hypothetical protein